MHRKFIAIVLTISVIVTAVSARTAAASDKDTARLLAGLAGLAVISAILIDQSKKKKTYSSVTRNYDERQLDPGKYHRDNSHNKYQQKHRSWSARDNRKYLPSQCLRRLETRKGRFRVFGTECLKNNYRHTKRLPSQCYRKVQTYRGVRSGFSEYCLRTKGYVIARN